MQTILIACPVYDGKEYAFARWWKAISHITYQPVNVLVIDNSDTLDFYSKWRDKVPMEHLDLRGETGDRKIALSMDYIRELFLARNNYQAYLNVEADILVPPTVVDIMLRQIQGVDFAAAPYPHRTEQRMIHGCFGCSMFNRRIAEVSFADAPADSHTDTFWRNKVLGRYRINDMPEYLLPLEHLNE